MSRGKNKRSPMRMQMIDDYIRAHYPERGKAIAKELHETEKYVQQRAWYLKVRYTQKHPDKPKARDEIKRLKAELNEWKRKYTVLKIRYQRLQRECHND